MKKQSIFSVLGFISMFVSARIFFSSCQSEDTIVAIPTPITNRSTPPDVPSNLVIDAGHEVSFHTFADGVQVYVSTETAPGVYKWVLKEPIANLYANANFNGITGTHYIGPTWESNSGSKVVAKKVDEAIVDANAIPWLKLQATVSFGPGVFNGTTFIQRVNTTGGKAPLTGANASNVGEELHVPYTAEYYFYKAE